MVGAHWARGAELSQSNVVVFVSERADAEKKGFVMVGARKRSGAEQRRLESGPD